MATTRRVLQEYAAHVDESMGVRQVAPNPRWGPIASTKDVGRTPLRTFGRLSIKQIARDANQPRSDFEAEEIQWLASSIRKTGQLHPIRVRWDDGVEKWTIVTGERRYRAAVAAGLDEIDCFFHDDDITESEVLEQQLVENLLRQDLKPLEEARGYAALIEVNGWNGKQVAEALRVSPSRVSRALALLDLPTDVQSRIESGEIVRTSAYELTKLNNANAQRKLAAQAAAGTLTQRKATKAVRQRKGKSNPRPRGVHKTFVAQNGIKVIVTASRRGNYHEVEEALQEALEEVRLRIDNRVQM